MNWKVHADCDLNFIVKGEGLLNVTGSHIYRKSGNISEKVLNFGSCNHISGMAEARVFKFCTQVGYQVLSME